MFMVFGEVPKNHVEGQIRCADISSQYSEAFYKFVQTSSGNIYELLTGWEKYETYNIDGVRGIKITNDHIDRAMYIKDDEYADSGWILGGRTIGVINSKTVDFFGHIENIKSILFQSGYDCNIQDYLILGISYCAGGVIWVNTDKGYYYITFHDENITKVYLDDAGILEGDDENNHFIYKVYNSGEFLEYLSYQDAEVLVNSKKITTTNYYSKIRGHITHISLRTVLEALGAVVTWNDEKQAILFTYEDIQYYFEANGLGTSYLYTITPGGEMEQVIAGRMLWYYMVDGRTIITEDSIKPFAKIFGKRVKIDYDELTVDFVDI